MKAYHRTDAASAILAEGFSDGHGFYLTDKLWSGVWVSADAPLNEYEGARGADVIEVELPVGVFKRYEWVEEGKPYREALIPARVMNRHPRRLYEEEVPE